jgi:hypothetical protein
MIPIQTVPRFSRRAVAKSSTLCGCVSHTSTLPDEPAQTCGPLAALMLAHNWFGGRFVEARGRLDGQTTGHFLGIFNHIQRIYLTPAHRDHAVGLLITREAVVTAAGQ